MDTSQIPVGIEPTQETSLPQEEMKSNLMSLMGKINNRYKEFSDNRSAIENKVEGAKNKTLEKVYDIFKSVGVNPADPKQVQSFLNVMKSNNPELSSQVEKTLQGFAGGTNMNIKNADTHQTI